MLVAKQRNQKWCGKVTSVWGSLILTKPHENWAFNMKCPAHRTEKYIYDEQHKCERSDRIIVLFLLIQMWPASVNVAFWIKTDVHCKMSCWGKGTLFLLIAVTEAISIRNGVQRKGKADCVFLCHFPTKSSSELAICPHPPCNWVANGHFSNLGAKQLPSLLAFSSPTEIFVQTTNYIFVWFFNFLLLAGVLLKLFYYYFTKLL